MNEPNTTKVSAVKVAMWLALLLTAFFLLSNFRELRLNPFESIKFDTVHTVRVSPDGIYIIDLGGMRVMKMNTHGKAQYVLETVRGAEFSQAQDIVTLGGYFYLHDLIWHSDGLRIESERILEFDAKNGRFKGVRFEHSYEGGRFSPRIKGLTAVDGEVQFVLTDEEGFAVMSLHGCGDNVARRYRHKYENAVVTLQDFSMTPKGIFAVDKAGRIIRFGSGHEPIIVYTAKSGDNAEEFSLPLFIAADNAGGLYIIDKGKRNIKFLDTLNNTVSQFYATAEEHAERAAFSSINVYGDTVVFSDYANIYTVSVSGGEPQSLNVIEPEAHLTLFWLALLIATLALATLTLTFMVIKMVSFLKLGKFESKQQVILIIVLTALLVSVFIISSIMKVLTDESRGEMLNRLSAIAILSQEILDGEAVANINSPQDYGSEHYNNLIRSLKTLVNRTHEWNSAIYSEVFKFTDDRVYSIARLDESIGAFYCYGEMFSGSDVEAIVESGGELVINDKIVVISGSFMAVASPIYNNAREIVGVIEVGISLSAYNARMAQLFREIIVGAILAIAILFFLMIEGVDVLFTFIRRAQIRENFRNMLLPVPYIRVLTFIIFAGFNLVTGFLPIYAGKFHAELWGISPSICAALPLVASQVMVAIAALITGKIVRADGIKRIFCIGALISVAGDFACATAGSFYVFLFAISFSGFGTGVVLACVNIYIASLENVDHKADGFNIFNSASFAGMNSGVLIGAALAVFIGQAYVFFASSFTWLIAFVTFLLLINHKVPKPVIIVEKSMGLMKFLLSRQVFVTLLLLFNYVTLNGFLFYFVPLFGEQIGMPETEISLMFIIHTIAVTLIGPAVMKKLKGVKNAPVILFATALSVASLMIVAYDSQLIYVIIAVIILGCSNCIGLACFPLYYSELEKTKNYGAEKSMSVYGGAQNLGYAAGPFTFGVAISAGLSAGFAVISAFTGGIMIVFALAAGMLKRKTINKSVN
jgi:predicted MFS family arabinose efflux permease